MFTTQEKVLAKVKNAQYHQFPGTTVTVACLELENGYCVTGQSACAIPAEFDEQKGKDYAFEDALKKVWDLEAYDFKSRLLEVGKASRYA